jgi:hypothetical protein
MTTATDNMSVTSTAFTVTAGEATETPISMLADVAVQLETQLKIIQLQLISAVAERKHIGEELATTKALLEASKQDPRQMVFESRVQKLKIIKEHLAVVFKINTERTLTKEDVAYVRMLLETLSDEENRMIEQQEKFEKRQLQGKISEKC